MRRALDFIIHAPTWRARLWRLAYTVDFHTGKRLKGNRPGTSQGLDFDRLVAAVWQLPDIPPIVAPDKPRPLTDGKHGTLRPAHPHQQAVTDAQENESNTDLT